MANELIVLIREFFRPKLKCERLGHKSLEQVTKGYSKPTDRYYVAMKAERVRCYCPRCGHEHSSTVRETGGGFTGFSWPMHMAEEFHRTGFVRSDQ